MNAVRYGRLPPVGQACMDLSIKYLSGSTVCDISVESSWRGADIKKYITSMHSSLPEAIQRLWYGHTEILNDMFVIDVIQESEAVLNLVLCESLLGKWLEGICQSRRSLGWHFEHASKDIREDYDCAMAVVRQDGRDLRLASEALLDDKRVVMAALSEGRYPYALRYASPRLQDDIELGRYALRRVQRLVREVYSGIAIGLDAHCVLEDLSPRLKDEKAFVLLAVEIEPFSVQHASARLRDDFDVIWAALASMPTRHEDDNNDGLTDTYACTILQFASDRMRTIPELVLFASLQNPEEVQHVSDELQARASFVVGRACWQFWRDFSPCNCVGFMMLASFWYSLIFAAFQLEQYLRQTAHARAWKIFTLHRALTATTVGVMLFCVLQAQLRFGIAKKIRQSMYGILATRARRRVL